MRAFTAIVAAFLVAGCSSAKGGSSSSGSSGTSAGSSGSSSSSTSGSSGSSASSSTGSSSSSTGGTTGLPWSYDGGACEPVPPQAVVDLSVPATTRTVTLSASDDLQAALDAAQPGDELVLPAGAVYAGNFELKPKSGSGWIVVRSSGLANLPPLGQRVVPARDAAFMARIETASSAPAISAQSGAGFWRFIGVEVGIASGNDTVYNLVELGDGSQTSASDLPHDVVLDRCWIHGNDTGNARRGVALNGDGIGIVGCDVDDFHEVGADSQALAGWNGGGPFTIVNDYLEGAGETVIFGGADPAVPNLVPSDIAILHNHITKRLTWKSDDPSYAGVSYSVKNDLELKNARRVWIEGNTIEKSWPMGQVGYAVLFTPRNQSGTAPWCGVQDVTLVHNLIEHAAGGVNLLDSDDANPSLATQRIRVADDLFLDIGYPDFGGDTKTFQFIAGGQLSASCVDFEHLTVDNGTTFGGVGDFAPIVDQFVFQDVIVGHGNYGFIGSNVGEGTPALTTYMTNWSFTGNVIYGGGSASQYPSGNAFPATANDVGFADPANGDWSLAPSSPYKGAATDGRDPGADVAAVMAAVQ